MNTSTLLGFFVPVLKNKNLPLTLIGKTQGIILGKREFIRIHQRNRINRSCWYTRDTVMCPCVRFLESTYTCIEVEFHELLSVVWKYRGAGQNIQSKFKVGRKSWSIGRIPMC